MDLISRETAKAEIEKYHMTSGVTNQGTWNECVDTVAHTVSELPSAFEGMTNGEVIQAVFPNASIYKHGSTYSVNNEYNFNSTWWNLPYKGDSE